MNSIEEQLKRTEVIVNNSLTDDQIKHQLFKDKALRCKFIALKRLNKNLYNTVTSLSQREKTKVLILMTELMKLDDTQLIEEFTEIAEDLLDNFNYEKVYVKTSNAPDPEYHKDLPPMTTS